MKSTTVALVLVAVALGGVVYVLESQGDSPSEAVESQGSQIFSFSEGDIQALSVQTQLRTLRFERDAEGEWQMLEPDSQPAEPASIAYLLNLLTTGRSDRNLTVGADDRESFGLDQPLATVGVTLENQETHEFVLGGYDFNRSFLYAVADPPAEEAEQLEVLLVSPNFENAVNRPLEEWKQAESSDNSTGTDSSSPESSEPLPTVAPAGPDAANSSAPESPQSDQP